MEKVTKQKETKKTEEERNRLLHQTNSARSAKKEFIESEYDYTTHAQGMSLEIFRELQNSNNTVNKQVNLFEKEVEVYKQDV